MDKKHRVYRLILALAFSVTRGPDVVETILKASAHPFASI